MEQFFLMKSNQIEYKSKQHINHIQTLCDGIYFLWQSVLSLAGVKRAYEHMKIAKNIKIQSKYPEYGEKI